MIKEIMAAADEDERTKIYRVVRAAAASDMPPSLADNILARYGDGKPHAMHVMARELEASEDDIIVALDVVADAPHNAKIEDQWRGRKPYYRIFLADRLIRLSEMSEKLSPWVDELVEQGKRHMATVSIGAVADCAHKLKRQIEAWASEPGVPTGDSTEKVNAPISGSCPLTYSTTKPTRSRRCCAARLMTTSIRCRRGFRL